MSSPTARPADAIDSPLALRHIPYTFSNEDADRSALELVQALHEDWEHSDGPVVFVRFTDGITNTLTKAVKQRPGRTEAERDDEAVLIRAYGKGTDVLIDREREVRAHNLLATLGLAPPLLARFENGIMYRFIQGDVCTPEDLRRPEIYRAVAKRLGQWHGCLPISAITDTPRLAADSPQSQHAGEKDGKASRPLPNLWTVMQQWIDALPSTTDAERQRNHLLNDELDWLSHKLGDTPGLIKGRDYVFGHCDLLSGNVIIERALPANGTTPAKKDLTVSFIDYEYATPAPAAFDIANHFAEWVGFACDHARVPTRSQRIDFLKSYVGSFRYHSISDEESLAIDIDMHNDVVTLLDQVDLFRGIPGFYWGIWALIQATISQIDFDYASYAELRLSEYWGWKGEFDGSRQRAGRELSIRERRWAEE